MRRAYPSLTLNGSMSLTVFVALVLGAIIALLSFGTRPAETQETSTELRYMVQDLGTFGGPYSTAHGINNADKVVGSSNLSEDLSGRAFLYSDGVMQDLGTLGGSYSSGAQDINDADKVVGGANTSGDADADGSEDFHAFLYSDGVMQDLGTLGGAASIAHGINDADKVVGGSYTSGGGFHAFLYSDGVMQDLNKLIPANSGWNLQAAHAINDKDQIVGFGVNEDGYGHALLLTPDLSLSGRVQALIDDVDALVASGSLTKGQGSALRTPLEGALKQWQKGHDKAAVERLQEFIDQVEAYIKAKKLSSAEGQPLIDEAQEIIDQLRS